MDSGKGNTSNTIRIMKFLLQITLLFLICSCSSYLQITNLDSNDKELVSKELAAFVFDCGDIIVAYDFWEKGGEVRFLITNETDENIYIDLTKSFLVINGASHDYYLMRTRTSGKISSVYDKYSYAAAVSLLDPDMNTGYGVGVSKEETYVEHNVEQVAYGEKPQICLPPHSSRLFSEYNLVNEEYKDNVLARKPKKHSMVEFVENESPLIVENRINVITESGEKTYCNKFYAASIMNIKADNYYQNPVDRLKRMYYSHKRFYFDYISSPTDINPDETHMVMMSDMFD